ncbi:hypothetical protein [Pseudonocardia sp. NPDC049154]
MGVLVHRDHLLLQVLRVGGAAQDHMPLTYSTVTCAARRHELL